MAGVTPVPEFAEPSKAYQDAFNLRGAEVGITFLGDKEGGRVNFPDVELGEVEVAKEAVQKYGLDGTNPTKSTAGLNMAMLSIMEVIETRRQTVNRLAYTQLKTPKSDSFRPEVFGQLNKAEQKWYSDVARTIIDGTLTIFGKQAHHQFELLDAWMKLSGDQASKIHYSRMRQVAIPPLMEKTLSKIDFKEPGKYANPFPWFPAAPKYNAMWPADFSEDELKYVNGTYDFEDPIRRVYTVVERLDTSDPREFMRLKDNPRRNSKGEAVEWTRGGPGNNHYRVTNIAFHPRYRGDFQKMAEVLRKSADVEVGGATLDPQFRAYTLTMADAFENGNFYDLLKADMVQTNGNLFITAYQHEGYWSDGVKFPIMMEIGIRDKKTTDRILENSDVFQWLERVTAEEVQKYLPDYKARSMSAEDIQKSAALVWAIAYGGFMQAYKRSPAGHDYPKRPTPGVSGHKTVLCLDVLKTWVPDLEKIGKDILASEDAKHMSFDGLVAFAAWHEGTHGTGNRSSTPVQNTGRTMGDVFGDYWGLQAETYADAGAIIILDKLRRTLSDAEYKEEVARLEKAKCQDKTIDEMQYWEMMKKLNAWRKAPRISEAEYREAVMSGIGMELRRAWAKNLALTSDYQLGDPHGVGSNIMLGWFYEKGALKLGKDERLHVDWDRLVPVTEALRSKLIEFASMDNLKGFQKWITERINAIPDGLDARLMSTKKAASETYVVDRGFGFNPKLKEE